MTADEVAGMDHGQLVAIVLELFVRFEALASANEALVAANDSLMAENARLRSEGAKNSGNSSKPPSRDPAVERARQAKERQEKKARAGGKRRPGKQPGTKGNSLEMTDTPTRSSTMCPPPAEDVAPAWPTPRSSPSSAAR